jgi:ubiquitin thioesterase OTU1
MPIRIRVRAPNGQHTVSLQDDAAVSDLLSSISDVTALPLFKLKWGYPLQPLDPSLYGMPTLLRDTDLKLNGAAITVLAEETGDASGGSLPQDAAGAQQSQSAPLSLQRKQNMDLKDSPEVPVPQRGGTMVLRVMPDDNSCMFRALGSAVLSDSLDAMTELRSMVAQGIQADPDMYNEATLEKTPDDYCKWIQYADSWGGGIELSILSQDFNIEICSINVQDLRVDKFNEGMPKRCFLVYSGIHYDTIAFVPDGVSTLDTENDQKVFDASDDVLLEAARQLCGELRKKHYYTDTQRFSIRCKQCQWKGNGEKAALEHAQSTGHNKLEEAS